MAPLLPLSDPFNGFLKRPTLAHLTCQALDQPLHLPIVMTPSTSMVITLHRTHDPRHYAEAAHIRPLGTPHNGPDSMENLLCLNHRVALDKYGYSIADDGTLIGIDGKLTVKSKHH